MLFTVNKINGLFRVYRCLCVLYYYHLHFWSGIIMLSFELRKSDLNSRVLKSDLVSEAFSRDVLQVLDADSLCVSSLCDVIGLYLDDIDRIRKELSRVPVRFVYRSYGHVNYRCPIPPLIISYGLQRGVYHYAVGSEECPSSVLPVSEEHLSVGQVVWCLYPVDLASRCSFPLVSVWSEADSLVDMLLGVYQVDSASVRCEVSREADNDVLWHFSIVSQSAATETHSVSRVQSLEGTPKEQILAYVREHGVVSASELQAQGFCGRSRLFAILRELQREDKIDQPKYGFYEAL